MSQDRGSNGGLAYGEMLPKLEADDTDGKPVALTIAKVRMQNMAPDGQRPENKLIIEFGEGFKPRKGFSADAAKRREYIANATSYKTLCAKLGNDWEKWVGQPCVMAPTTTTFNDKSYEKIHVAALDRWDKVLAATSRARTASKR